MRLAEAGEPQAVFDNVRAFSVPDSAAQLSSMLGRRAFRCTHDRGLLTSAHERSPEMLTPGRPSISLMTSLVVVPEPKDLPDGEIGELLRGGPARSADITMRPIATEAITTVGSIDRATS